MSNGKKPGDEAIRGAPAPAPKRNDSFMTRPSAPTQPGVPGAKQPVTGSGRVPEVAPEVSRGAWRERVFTPRAVLSREEIAQALEAALRAAIAVPGPLAAAQVELRGAWMPVLRQALEQAGGDGLDCWLLGALKPPGRSPHDTLWRELVQALSSLADAPGRPELETSGRAVIALVQQALLVDRPKKLSFKQLERELEGKLEVDELLCIGTAGTAVLERRLEELGATLEQLRDQIKTRPGAKPDGMYSNFSRLKVEARVLAAELKRRGPTA